MCNLLNQHQTLLVLELVVLVASSSSSPNINLTRTAKLLTSLHPTVLSPTGNSQLSTVILSCVAAKCAWSCGIQLIIIILLLLVHFVLTFHYLLQGNY